MRRRYTKAEREQAAQLCSMCACDRAANGYASTYDAARCIDASRVSANLADYAWHQVHCAFIGSMDAIHIVYAEAYAEAEALIRTGWSP